MASTPRPDIKKVADLKGKQIAVSAPNSMPDMLARAALAKFGVADKDVKLPPSAATKTAIRL